MQLFFTPLPIISATIASFIFGALWYSPLLFRGPWLKVNHLTEGTIPKRPFPYMISVHVYSLVAHGCIAAVLALIFDLVDVRTFKVALSLGGLLALGFIVATKYIDMLFTLDGTHWERRSQIKFLIGAGYYVCTVLLMTGVLILVNSTH